MCIFDCVYVIHRPLVCAGVTHSICQIVAAVQPQSAAPQLGPEGGVVLDHTGTVSSEQTGLLRCFKMEV